jgi:hypothetical protein
MSRAGLFKVSAGMPATRDGHSCLRRIYGCIGQVLLSAMPLERKKPQLTVVCNLRPGLPNCGQSSYSVASRPGGKFDRSGKTRVQLLLVVHLDDPRSRGFVITGCVECAGA